MRRWKRTSKSVKKELIVPHQLVKPEVSADGLFDYPESNRNLPNTFIMHLPLDPLLAAQIRTRPRREGMGTVSFDMKAHDERVNKALNPVIKQNDPKGRLHE